MKRKSIIGILVSLTLFAAGATWKGKMSDLAAALSGVIPDLFPSTHSRQDLEALKRKTEKILSIVRTLDQSSPHAVHAPDKDPSLAYISQLLRENIESADASLKEGHVEYAKSLLRSSVSYCIACHTRTNVGPQFPLLRAFDEPLKHASWIDRITFEAASRQFDLVYDAVMKELKTGLGSSARKDDLETASKIALAISIRVKQNPEKAIQLAQSIIDSPYATPSLKEDAKSWLTDLKAWQLEPLKPVKSNEELLRSARHLLAAGTRTWIPHSEVRYLRASLLMHELLQRAPNNSSAAEAFYLIGLSYDRLHDLGLWSLHEMYFQACIKKAPHSDLALKCYRNYEDSVRFGFTGSAGTFIPASVQRHLNELRALASPVTKE